MKKEEVADFLEDSLSSMSLENNTGNQKNVGKILFDDKHVTGKTELSARQINAMARLRFATRLLQSELHPVTNKPYTIEENMSQLIEDIKIMAVSHKRQSRSEFVESQKILNAQTNIANTPDQNRIR